MALGEEGMVPAKADEDVVGEGGTVVADEEGEEGMVVVDEEMAMVARAVHIHTSHTSMEPSKGICFHIYHNYRD